MKRILLILVVMVGCSTAASQLSAQPASPMPDHGTNYDPPPATPKREPPPPPPEPEKPFFQWGSIDWSDKHTWLKLALIVGSIVLARRAFRQMKGDY